MIIYQITNNVNKKKYIGQTFFSLDKRMQEHIKESRKVKPCLYIHRAIKKYGVENFSFQILCECSSKEQLDFKEKYFIEKENTLVPNGYNLLLDATGGDLFSQHPNKDYVRKRISDGTKAGIARSQKSWSESHKGEKNGMYGKKHSPETIEKMKQNRKGKGCGDRNGMRIQGVAERQHLNDVRNSDYRTKKEG